MPDKRALLISSLIYFLLLEIAFIIPIFFSIHTNDTFVLAKSTIFEIFSSLLIIIFVLSAIINRKEKFSYSPYCFPLILLFIVSFFSIFRYTNTVNAWLEWLYLVSLMAFFLIIFHSNIDSSQILKITWITVLMGILCAVYGLFQNYGFDPILTFTKAKLDLPVGLGKLFSTFSNPNSLAGFLSALLPVLLALLLIHRSKILKISLAFSGLIMFLVIVLCGARSPALGLILSFSIFLLFLNKIRGRHYFWRNKTWIALTLLLIIIILVIYSTKNPLNQQFRMPLIQRYLKSFQEIGTVQYRILIYQIATRMIKEHPCLGLGIGNYKYFSALYQIQFLSEDEQRDKYHIAHKSDKLHNDYFQAGVEMGFLGLLLSLWLAFIFIKRGWLLCKYGYKNQKNNIIVLGFYTGGLQILFDGLLNFPFQVAPLAMLMCFFAVFMEKMSFQEKSRIPAYEKFTFTKGIKISRKVLFPTFIILIFLILFANKFILSYYFANCYLGQGNFHLQHEEAAEAVEKYNKGLEYFPAEGEMLYRRGTAYSLLKEYEKAEADFLKSLENFQSYLVYTDLGCLYYTLGQKENKKEYLYKAIENLEKAIKIRYIFPVAHYNLGWVYYELRLYKSAKRAFELSASIPPYIADGLRCVGDIYFEQKRYNKALTEYQKALEMDPSLKQARAGVVSCIKEMSRSDKAMAREKQKKISPDQ